MQSNLGDVDRTIRMSLGYVIVIAAAISETHWAWAILGAVLMASAALKWCPLYLPFHYSTADK